MKSNDNNANVGSWQYDLEAAGFWPSNIAHNTNFGPTTLAQTNAFKASVGLPQDGVVDETTWAKMSDVLRKKTSSNPLVEAALDAAEKELAMTNGLLNQAHLDQLALEAKLTETTRLLNDSQKNLQEQAQRSVLLTDEIKGAKAHVRALTEWSIK